MPCNYFLTSKTCLTQNRTLSRRRRYTAYYYYYYVYERRARVPVSRFESFTFKLYPKKSNRRRLSCVAYRFLFFCCPCPVKRGVRDVTYFSLSNSYNTESRLSRSRRKTTTKTHQRHLDKIVWS